MQGLIKQKILSFTCSNSKAIIAVVTGALFLLIPAIINGYPLLNQDDNTYLCSGFLPDTPVDRPITYGLILRLLSLNGLSLFYVAFFQCCLVSYLVYKLSSVVASVRNPILSHSFVMLFLSLLSPLSWISSELIPDVFTAIAFLSLVLIVLDKHTKRKVSYFIFYTIAVATHFSNVLIFCSLVLILLFFRRQIFESDRIKHVSKSLFILLFAGLATVSIMGSALSKSKDVFAVGALLDQGILKPYLDEHCRADDFKICLYKDSLPKDANYFLWDTASPLYKSGGWAANKTDFNKINRGTISDPKYLKLRIKMATLNTLRQCMEFGIGDGNVVLKSLLPENIKLYIPADIQHYSTSLQNRNVLAAGMKLINILFYAVIIFFSGFIFIVLCSPLRKKLTKSVQAFMKSTFLLIGLNMFFCATFSQVIGRYGCRVIWLLPFVGLILVMEIYRQKTGRISA